MRCNPRARREPSGPERACPRRRKTLYSPRFAALRSLVPRRLGPRTRTDCRRRLAFAPNYSTLLALGSKGVSNGSLHSPLSLCSTASATLLLGRRHMLALTSCSTLHRSCSSWCLRLPTRIVVWLRSLCRYAAHLHTLCCSPPVSRHSDSVCASLAPPSVGYHHLALSLSTGLRVTATTPPSVAALPKLTRALTRMWSASLPLSPCSLLRTTRTLLRHSACFLITSGC